jgi:hypothetical protein
LSNAEKKERSSGRGEEAGEEKESKQEKKGKELSCSWVVMRLPNQYPMLPPASDQEYKKKSMQCDAEIRSQASKSRKIKQKRTDLRELKRSQRRVNKKKKQQIV